MKRNTGLFALGIVFIALGAATNVAFYGVGIAFLVMGLVSLRHEENSRR